jgi:hypothetical protein
MSDADIFGQIVGGQTAQIMIREKSGTKIELGDLLVSDTEEGFLILQVYNLLYGSQIPQATREHLAGMKLEGIGAGLEFLEPGLRNYVMAEVKALVQVNGKDVRLPKVLPKFFASIRHITKEDLAFLTKPQDPLYLGKVRSGSKVLDVDVYLNGTEALTHHILIPATTGRGKSNLVRVILWSALGSGKFGFLVLDPHDEYFGRHGKGLRHHPKSKSNLLYYSADAPAGENTLVINLKSIMPGHFDGIVHFTEAQQDAIARYYNKFGDAWIENIARATPVQDVGERTIQVLRRKFDNMLGVYVDDAGSLQCRSAVFSDAQGLKTIKDIVRALEDGKCVIIDTSRLVDEAELMIGSIVAGEIFRRYQRYNSEGKIDEKPVVSVVVEEAPRVLGEAVLAESGDNIYSTIAREGRKFKVGIVAISQLTSLIPRAILANMNTKVILGNEMVAERRAVIDSAAQDLSEDNRTIASLDKGEAIVSSIFTKFAVPIQIPLFDDYAAVNPPKARSEKTGYVG